MGGGDMWNASTNNGNNGNTNDDRYRSDALMVTDEVEELRNLRSEGYVCACPPGDDDDAYALALARGEEDRAARSSLLNAPSGAEVDNDTMRNGNDDDGGMAMAVGTTMALEEPPPPSLPLGGYVLSNDFFRDAIRRDRSLRSWLDGGGRISYAFANVGGGGGFGSGGEEDGLQFVPNPRNPLIEVLEKRMRQQHPR